MRTNQTYQAWSARNSNMQVGLKSLDSLSHQNSVKSSTNIQKYQGLSATYYGVFSLVTNVVEVVESRTR